MVLRSRGYSIACVAVLLLTCFRASSVQAALVHFDESFSIDLPDDPKFKITVNIALAPGSENGWVGIGVQPDGQKAGMISADMMIVTLNKEVAELDDYFSTTWGAPVSDVALGGTNDLEAFSATLISSDPVYNWTLTWERSLTTGDRQDKAIADPLLLIAAYSDRTSDFASHGPRRGYTQVKLSDKTVDFVIWGVTGTTYALRLTHGIMMSLAFYVLLPATIVLVHLQKQKQPRAIPVHKYAGTIASVLIVVAFILGTASVPLNRHLSLPHHYVGISLIGLVMFLVVLTWMGLDPSSNDPNSHPSLSVHRWLGYAIVVPAMVQVYLGVSLWDDQHFTTPLALTLAILLPLLFLAPLGKSIADVYRARTASIWGTSVPLYLDQPSDGASCFSSLASCFKRDKNTVRDSVSGDNGTSSPRKGSRSQQAEAARKAELDAIGNAVYGTLRSGKSSQRAKKDSALDFDVLNPNGSQRRKSSGRRSSSNRVKRSDTPTPLQRRSVRGGAGAAGRARSRSDQPEARRKSSKRKPRMPPVPNMPVPELTPDAIAASRSVSDAGFDPTDLDRPASKRSSVDSATTLVPDGEGRITMSLNPRKNSMI